MDFESLKHSTAEFFNFPYGRISDYSASTAAPAGLIAM
ncbi:hypothetical protein EhV156_00376 [Emiliania huxleyi virus 156]|nr:hypothetical protein EhV156_00376 [Emiliania huxleyi virus 156]